MASHMSVDVGGTFTDLACVDDDRNFQIAKSPTTPEDYPNGIEKCVDLLAGSLAGDRKRVLEACRQFIHGSTIITNAVIEGKVAKVGLIVTKGFRDILTIREGGKTDCYNLREDYPRPFVPRYLTLAVTERMNAEGGIEIPLDETEAEEALRTLIEDFQVEAVAVCLLWSIANATHEQKIGEIASRRWPKTTCVLSSQTNPVIREYRRAVSTVIEASVRSLAGRYMHDVARRLSTGGYAGTLYMVTSSGAILGAEEAGTRGLALIGSGPAMAPIAGRWFAAMEGDERGDLIVTDMGGTSFDITLVTGGEIVRTRESRVGNEILGVSAIDSRSIGAGGGSVAWIDPGGLIQLGPESAGAIPGPACYGHGGTEATVTDANVVLGYINPDNFLGGRMSIDPLLAHEAIRTNIAEPLGLDVREAAFAIWSTINVNMASAIQDVTIWHGIDPRGFCLISGGGAGNCHAVALARSMGVADLLVPKYGGVLSAVGGLIADVCADFGGSYFTNTKAFDYAGVNRLLERLEIEAVKFLSGLSADPSDCRIEFSVEARYSYQVWDLPIRLGGKRVAGPEDLREVIQRFHAAHAKVFAVSDPGQSIEFINWSARAIAQMPELKLKRVPDAGKDPAPARTPAREAYFRELGGMRMAQVYRGELLAAGNIIDGPAVIEESTTTIVVPPAARARVTQFGNYWIDAQV